MTRQSQRPAPGTRVRYRADGKDHVGMVHATPTQRADESFPVQDIAPPYGYIQAWPGDPRILNDDDDT